MTPLPFDLVGRLRSEAEVLAESLLKELVGALREKQELERGASKPWRSTRLAFLDRAIEAGAAAPGRLQVYRPELHEPLDCPYCWMLEGEHRTLHLVPGMADAIGCACCGAEYQLGR